MEKRVLVSLYGALDLDQSSVDVHDRYIEVSKELGEDFAQFYPPLSISSG